MGKLYLPKETHGLWNTVGKSLTIFVGEDAYVGYQGTAAEVDGMAFSAFGSILGECANEVYNEGIGRRSARIDTGKPGTLQFTCTDANGTALAPPITIFVRMPPNYAQMTPEGQADETACWAACLTWWLHALPDRPQNVTQQDFLNKIGVGLWNKADGTINPAQLELLVAKNGYRMKCQRVQPTQLSDYLGNWPMILGFTAAGGFAHMNVLCGYDPIVNTIDTMEPMYPDPVNNSDFRMIGAGNAGVPLFFNKVSGDPFIYDGTVRTGVSFSSFSSSPMQGGYFWIGYPQEYTARP